MSMRDLIDRVFVVDPIIGLERDPPIRMITDKVYMVDPVIGFVRRDDLNHDYNAAYKYDLYHSARPKINEILTYEPWVRRVAEESTSKIVSDWAKNTFNYQCGEDNSEDKPLTWTGMMNKVLDANLNAELEKKLVDLCIYHMEVDRGY